MRIRLVAHRLFTSPPVTVTMPATPSRRSTTLPRPTLFLSLVILPLLLLLLLHLDAVDDVNQSPPRLRLPASVAAGIGTTSVVAAVASTPGVPRWPLQLLLLHHLLSIPADHSILGGGVGIQPAMAQTCGSLCPDSLCISKRCHKCLENNASCPLWLQGRWSGFHLRQDGTEEQATPWELEMVGVNVTLSGKGIEGLRGRAYCGTRPRSSSGGGVSVYDMDIMYDEPKGYRDSASKSVIQLYSAGLTDDNVRLQMLLPPFFVPYDASECEDPRIPDSGFSPPFTWHWPIRLHCSTPVLESRCPHWFDGKWSASQWDARGNIGGHLASSSQHVVIEGGGMYMSSSSSSPSSSMGQNGGATLVTRYDLVCSQTGNGTGQYDATLDLQTRLGVDMVTTNTTPSHIVRGVALFSSFPGRFVSTMAEPNWCQRPRDAIQGSNGSSHYSFAHANVHYGEPPHSKATFVCVEPLLPHPCSLFLLGTWRSKARNGGGAGSGEQRISMNVTRKRTDPSNNGSFMVESRFDGRGWSEIHTLTCSSAPFPSAPSELAVDMTHSSTAAPGTTSLFSNASMLGWVTHAHFRFSLSYDKLEFVAGQPGKCSRPTFPFHLDSPSVPPGFGRFSLECAIPILSDSSTKVSRVINESLPGGCPAWLLGKRNTSDGLYGMHVYYAGPSGGDDASVMRVDLHDVSGKPGAAPTLTGNVTCEIPSTDMPRVVDTPAAMSVSIIFDIDINSATPTSSRPSLSGWVQRGAAMYIQTVGAVQVHIAAPGVCIRPTLDDNVAVLPGDDDHLRLGVYECSTPPLVGACPDWLQGEWDMISSTSSSNVSPEEWADYAIEPVRLAVAGHKAIVTTHGGESVVHWVTCGQQHPPPPTKLGQQRVVQTTFTVDVDLVPSLSAAELSTLTGRTLRVLADFDTEHGTLRLSLAGHGWCARPTVGERDTHPFHVNGYACTTQKFSTLRAGGQGFCPDWLDGHWDVITTSVAASSDAASRLLFQWDVMSNSSWVTPGSESALVPVPDGYNAGVPAATNMSGSIGEMDDSDSAPTAFSGLAGRPFVSVSCGTPFSSEDGVPLLYPIDLEYTSIATGLPSIERGWLRRVQTLPRTSVRLVRAPPNWCYRHTSPQEEALIDVVTANISALSGGGEAAVDPEAASDDQDDEVSTVRVDTPKCSTPVLTGQCPAWLRGTWKFHDENQTNAPASPLGLIRRVLQPRRWVVDTNARRVVVTDSLAATIRCSQSAEPIPLSLPATNSNAPVGTARYWSIDIAYEDSTPWRGRIDHALVASLNSTAGDSVYRMSLVEAPAGWCSRPPRTFYGARRSGLYLRSIMVQVDSPRPLRSFLVLPLWERIGLSVNATSLASSSASAGGSVSAVTQTLEYVWKPTVDDRNSPVDKYLLMWDAEPLLAVCEVVRPSPSNTSTWLGGPFGACCDSNADCSSGVCDTTNRVCTFQCRTDSDCPGGNFSSSQCVYAEDNINNLCHASQNTPNGVPFCKEFCLQAEGPNAQADIIAPVLEAIDNLAADNSAACLDRVREICGSANTTSGAGRFSERACHRWDVRSSTGLSGYHTIRATDDGVDESIKIGVASLVVGTPYYSVIYAHNEVGLGWPTQSLPLFEIPRARPPPPASLHVSQVDVTNLISNSTDNNDNSGSDGNGNGGVGQMTLEDAKTSVLVRFRRPQFDNGADISKYMIEWHTDPSFLNRTERDMRLSFNDSSLSYRYGVGTDDSSGATSVSLEGASYTSNADAFEDDVCAVHYPQNRIFSQQQTYGTDACYSSGTQACLRGGSVAISVNDTSCSTYPMCPFLDTGSAHSLCRTLADVQRQHLRTESAVNHTTAQNCTAYIDSNVALQLQQSLLAGSLSCRDIRSFEAAMSPRCLSALITHWSRASATSGGVLRGITLSDGSMSFRGTQTNLTTGDWHLLSEMQDKCPRDDTSVCDLSARADLCLEVSFHCLCARPLDPGCSHADVRRMLQVKKHGDAANENMMVVPASSMESSTAAEGDFNIIVSNILPRTPYYVRVAAVNHIGEGLYRSTPEPVAALVIAERPQAVAVTFANDTITTETSTRTTTTTNFFFSQGTWHTRTVEVTSARAALSTSIRLSFETVDIDWDWVTRYRVEYSHSPHLNDSHTPRYILDVPQPSFSTPFQSRLVNVTVPELIPGERYYFQVSAYITTYGRPQRSFPYHITPPLQTPDPPRHMLVGPVNGSVLKVEWQIPLFDGGRPLLHHKLVWSIYQNLSCGVSSSADVCGVLVLPLFNPYSTTVVETTKTTTTQVDGNSSTPVVTTTSTTRAVPQSPSKSPLVNITQEARISNLFMGSFYYVQLTSCNSLGCGVPTVTPKPVKPMEPPSPPTKVHVRVYNHSALRLRFAKPLSDGGDSIDQYVVTCSVPDGASSLRAAHDENTTYLHSSTLTVLPSPALFVNISQPAAPAWDGCKWCTGYLPHPSRVGQCCCRDADCDNSDTAEHGSLRCHPTLHTCSRTCDANAAAVGDEAGCSAFLLPGSRELSTAMQCGTDFVDKGMCVVGCPFNSTHPLSPCIFRPNPAAADQSGCNNLRNRSGDFYGGWPLSSIYGGLFEDNMSFPLVPSPGCTMYIRWYCSLIAPSDPACALPAIRHVGHPIPRCPERSAPHVHEGMLATVLVPSLTSTAATMPHRLGVAACNAAGCSEIANYTALVTPRARIVFSTSTLCAIEGGAAYSSTAADVYMVSLNSKPLHDVMLHIEGAAALAQATTEVQTAPTTSIVFTQQNWNTPQRVYLRAIDDDWDEKGPSKARLLQAEAMVVILSHRITTKDTSVSSTIEFVTQGIGEDTLDTGLGGGVLNVTVHDDDYAGLALSATSIVLTEGQRGQVVRLKAMSRPRCSMLDSGAVRLSLHPPTSTSANVSSIFLETSSGDWAKEHSIMFTAVDDHIDEVDREVEAIRWDVLNSGDYSQQSVPPTCLYSPGVLQVPVLSTIVVDNDAASVQIDLSLSYSEVGLLNEKFPWGLNFLEGGIAVTYRVRITSQPRSKVAILITSTAQRREKEQRAAALNTSALRVASTCAFNRGDSAPSLLNDTECNPYYDWGLSGGPGLSTTSTSLWVTNDGTPTVDVAAIYFEPLDWNVSQFFMLSCREDDIDVGPNVFNTTLTHTSISEDPKYNYVPNGTVLMPVHMQDDDEADMTLSRWDVVATEDGIYNSSYTVILETAPTSTTCIHSKFVDPVLFPTPSWVQITPAVVCFGAHNWSQAQAITLSATTPDPSGTSLRVTSGKRGAIVGWVTHRVGTEAVEYARFREDNDPTGSLLGDVEVTVVERFSDLDLTESPQYTRAIFSDVAHEVLVMFAEPGAYVEPDKRWSIRHPCNVYFLVKVHRALGYQISTSEGSGSYTNPACYWSDRYTLHAQLGDAWSVQPGDKIALRSGAIRSTATSIITTGGYQVLEDRFPAPVLSSIQFFGARGSSLSVSFDSDPAVGCWDGIQDDPANEQCLSTFENSNALLGAGALCRWVGACTLQVTLGYGAKIRSANDIRQCGPCECRSCVPTQAYAQSGGFDDLCRTPSHGCQSPQCFCKAIQPVDNSDDDSSEDDDIGGGDSVGSTDVGLTSDPALCPDGRSLHLLPGAVKSIRFALLSAVGCAHITSSLEPANPIARIHAARYFSACASYTIWGDSSETSGGGRDSFYWELTALTIASSTDMGVVLTGSDYNNVNNVTLSASAMAIISAANQQGNVDVLHFPAHAFSGGVRYRMSLRVAHFLAPHVANETAHHSWDERNQVPGASVTQHEFIPAVVPMPSLTVVGPLRRIVSVSKSLVLGAIAKPSPCSASSGSKKNNGNIDPLVFSWYQVQGNLAWEDNVVAQQRSTTVIDGETAINQPVLTLEPFTLTPGQDYIFRVSAHTKSLPALANYEDVIVSARSGLLIAGLGDAARDVGADQAISLDAGKYSGHEDATAETPMPLLFFWSCEFEETSPGNGDCDSVIAPFTGGDETAGGSAMLTLPRGTFSAGDIVIFRVIVSLRMLGKMSGDPAAFTTVRVLSAGQSVATIRMANDAGPNSGGIIRVLNPATDKVSLSADVNWGSDTDVRTVEKPNRQLLWEETSGALSLLAEANGHSYVFATPLDRAYLVIRPGVLIPGRSYTFRLSASDATVDNIGGRGGAAEVTVVANRPPHGGYLSVTPVNGGVALETPYRFALLGWSDDEGDFPLRFAFSADGIMLSASKHQNSEAEFRLSLPRSGSHDASRSNVSYPEGRVYDALGAVSITQRAVSGETVRVDVLPPSPSSAATGDDAAVAAVVDFLELQRREKGMAEDDAFDAATVNAAASVLVPVSCDRVGYNNAALNKQCKSSLRSLRSFASSLLRSLVESERVSVPSVLSLEQQASSLRIISTFARTVPEQSANNVLSSSGSELIDEIEERTAYVSGVLDHASTLIESAFQEAITLSETTVRELHGALESLVGAAAHDLSYNAHDPSYEGTNAQATAAAAGSDGSTEDGTHEMFVGNLTQNKNHSWTVGKYISKVMKRMATNILLTHVPGEEPLVVSGAQLSLWAKVDRIGRERGDEDEQPESEASTFATEYARWLPARFAGGVDAAPTANDTDHIGFFLPDGLAVDTMQSMSLDSGPYQGPLGPPLQMVLVGQMGPTMSTASDILGSTTKDADGSYRGMTLGLSLFAHNSEAGFSGTIPPTELSVAGLSRPVQLLLPVPNTAGNIGLDANTQCLFWDDSQQRWSQRGVYVGGSDTHAMTTVISMTTVTCMSTHLTSFLLRTKNPAFESASRTTVSSEFESEIHSVPDELLFVYDTSNFGVLGILLSVIGFHLLSLGVVLGAEWLRERRFDSEEEEEDGGERRRRAREQIQRRRQEHRSSSPTGNSKLITPSSPSGTSDGSTGKTRPTISATELAEAARPLSSLQRGRMKRFLGEGTTLWVGNRSRGPEHLNMVGFARALFCAVARLNTAAAWLLPAQFLSFGRHLYVLHLWNVTSVVFFVACALIGGAELDETESLPLAWICAVSGLIMSVGVRRWLLEQLLVWRSKTFVNGDVGSGTKSRRWCCCFFNSRAAVTVKPTSQRDTSEALRRRAKSSSSVRSQKAAYTTVALSALRKWQDFEMLRRRCVIYIMNKDFAEALAFRWGPTDNLWMVPPGPERDKITDAPEDPLVTERRRQLAEEKAKGIAPGSPGSLGDLAGLEKYDAKLEEVKEKQKRKKSTQARSGSRTTQTSSSRGQHGGQHGDSSSESEQEGEESTREEDDFVGPMRRSALNKVLGQGDGWSFRGPIKPKIIIPPPKMTTEEFLTRRAMQNSIDSSRRDGMALGMRNYRLQGFKKSNAGDGMMCPSELSYDRYVLQKRLMRHRIFPRFVYNTVVMFQSAWRGHVVRRNRSAFLGFVGASAEKSVSARSKSSNSLSSDSSNDSGAKATAVGTSRLTVPFLRMLRITMLWFHTLCLLVSLGVFVCGIGTYWGIGVGGLGGTDSGEGNGPTAAAVATGAHDTTPAPAANHGSAGILEVDHDYTSAVPLHRVYSEATIMTGVLGMIFSACAATGLKFLNDGKAGTVLCFVGPNVCHTVFVGVLLVLLNGATVGDVKNADFEEYRVVLNTARFEWFNLYESGLESDTAVLSEWQDRFGCCGVQPNRHQGDATTEKAVAEGACRTEAATSVQDNHFAMDSANSSTSASDDGQEETAAAGLSRPESAVGRDGCEFYLAGIIERKTVTLRFVVGAAFGLQFVALIACCLMSFVRTGGCSVRQILSGVDLDHIQKIMLDDREAMSRLSLRGRSAAQAALPSLYTGLTKPVTYNAVVTVQQAARVFLAKRRSGRMREWNALYEGRHSARVERSLCLALSMSAIALDCMGIWLGLKLDDVRDRRWRTTVQSAFSLLFGFLLPVCGVGSIVLQDKWSHWLRQRARTWHR